MKDLFCCNSITCHTTLPDRPDRFVTVGGQQQVKAPDIFKIFLSRTRTFEGKCPVTPVRLIGYIVRLTQPEVREKQNIVRQNTDIVRKGYRKIRYFSVIEFAFLAIAA